jgi:predicted PurR-regulated permease PerM/methylmalonyl-CoA mutase cobalamin-binding subunit
LIRTNNATASSGLLTLIAMAVVIVGLYFGRQVLIPLALAVVFAFLLTPAVGWLEKCRIGRVPAVLVVLLFAFVLLSFVGWMVTGQLMNIVEQFPSYQSNIHEKIQSLRVPSGSRLKNATHTVAELSKELSAASESAVDTKAGKASGARPIPVQVAQAPSNAPQYMRAVIGPLTGVFETSAMVVIFTLFMLVKREDLRNRVIRLAGQGQLTIVTQALDDASRRLSRYLLLQFLVNAAYGVIFGSIAYWIGIPHALLWGVLGGLLRFVPYVGSPIAAVFSMGMALAVFPGWHQAGMIFGLFVVLELILANLVEPWLYGAHTGISSLAILVAAVFWTILWGPVGLILSTPLTVCLILMGRYVPQLSFLEVLLGDEAVLPVESHFYQRLLALDQEEANDIAETYLKEKPIGSFYDSVLIPALALAEQDRHAHLLETETASFISQSTRDLIEDLGERSFDTPAMFNRDGVNGNDPDYTALSGLRVVCIPAGDDADELVAIMIAQLLKRLGCDVRHLALASRATILDEVATEAPQVVLVSALPPFAAGQARSLCKRLRQRHPEWTIVLGLWRFEGGVVKAQERVGSCGADMVATTLQQAISFLDETNQSIRSRKQTQVQSGFHQGIIATRS